MLATIQAKLLLVEKQLPASDEESLLADTAYPADKAYYTKVNSQGKHRGMECWYCHEAGHLKRDCPKRAKERENEQALFTHVIGL